MLLTVKEVAQTLSVTETCVYWLLRGKCLRYHRFGLGRGTIRIEDSELENFIRKNTVPRRGKSLTNPRTHAPSAFTHLNASRLREAWAGRGVVPPARQHPTCKPSDRRDASTPP